MRAFFLLFHLFLMIFPAVGQQNQASLAARGNTYAVVIGIGAYESEAITNLNYASRDAEVFAAYLKSPEGGGVPDDHLRLLVDKEATVAAIYNSLKWLKNKCEDDMDANPAQKPLVYFYFSGHGDLESELSNNLGFLLAVNTPANNYINNAVRIEDLDAYARILSANLGAEVVLITDACHSGSLAGGKNFEKVSRALSAAKDREIRIASCKPDELSQENEAWGGGRSVFSYYLVDGLKGKSDRDRNGVVTLGEVQQFVDSTIGNDPVLKEGRLVQTPVFRGNPVFPLAKVIPKNDLELILAAGAPAPVIFSVKNVFEVLDGGGYQHLDFKHLSRLTQEEIPVVVTEQLINAIPGLLLFEKQKTLKTDLIRFLSELREQKESREEFTEKLVEFLHGKGQAIINLYLKGDEAELERRRYYNMSSGYEKYPFLYDVLLKLTDKDNPLYHIFQVQQLYFSGLVDRLSLYKTGFKGFEHILERAITTQKKALALEKNAPYLHNELGVLYKIKKDFAAAEKYYLGALELAPSWAIPYSNLAGVYVQLNQPAKAENYFSKATRIQPAYTTAWVNGGILAEKKNNLLLAEELYRKSIGLNSRHYFPFERLGFLYMHTTDYAQADSFFFEADIRKKGLVLQDMESDGVIDEFNLVDGPPRPCPVNKADIRPDDIMGSFYLAATAENDSIAEKYYKKVIALDPSNPLAFHYLGLLLRKQKRWQEAEIIFTLAVKYYLEPEAFEHYCDSLAARMPGTESKNCLLLIFKGKHYKKAEDPFLLADVYEKWKHYAEAEEIYRQIIRGEKQNSTAINQLPAGGNDAAYHKYWQLLESLGRYEGAENIIHSFAAKYSWAGQYELYDFYRRMNVAFPDNGFYYYKAGMLLYAMAADQPEYFTADTKKMVPDGKSANDEDWAGTGSSDKRPPDLTGFAVPGTGEWIAAVKTIRYPRTEGITMLLKADSLLEGYDELLADINEKIGDLLTRQGLPMKAAPYYLKSVNNQNTNAGVRQKLATAFVANYQLIAAQLQLDTLYRKREINFTQQLLLGRLYIHAAGFTKADTLLREAAAAHPYKIPEIADLNGRRNLLSGNTKQAIGFYKDFLKAVPGDAGACYTLARLYAMDKKQKEALEWLRISITGGFRYGWVIGSDTVWDTYRNNAAWTTVVSALQPVVYKQPDKF